MFSPLEAFALLASLIVACALYALNALPSDALSGLPFSMTGVLPLEGSFSGLWHGALCIGIAFFVTELIDKLRR
jgi:hypothetical protein